MDMSAVVAPMSTPALEASAREAWAKYVSTCQMGGTGEQRAWAYKHARVAEQKLWVAGLAPAAAAD